MPIDRTLLKMPMTDSSAPPWHCPQCYQGTLDPMIKTLAKIETAKTKAGKGHPAWEPEWFTERFCMLMQCNRKDCREIVSVMGTTETRQEWDEQLGDVNYLEALRPSYFFPPIPLFEINEECPNEVKEHITKSFELIWCDPPASANRVRQAVEALYLPISKCHDLHVQKTCSTSRENSVISAKTARTWNTSLGRQMAWQ